MDKTSIAPQMEVGMCVFALFCSAGCSVLLCLGIARLHLVVWTGLKFPDMRGTGADSGHVW